jgi:hypothetical protein
MSTLVLARDLIDKLTAAKEPCWLRDDQGNVVGYFHPAKANGQRIYGEGEIPELSDEEIERRVQEPGGRTWPEIKRDLERLV